MIQFRKCFCRNQTCYFDVWTNSTVTLSLRRVVKNLQKNKGSITNTPFYKLSGTTTVNIYDLYKTLVGNVTSSDIWFSPPFPFFVIEAAGSHLQQIYKLRNGKMSYKYAKWKNIFFPTYTIYTFSNKVYSRQVLLYLDGPRIPVKKPLQNSW